MFNFSNTAAFIIVVLFLNETVYHVDSLSKSVRRKTQYIQPVKPLDRNDIVIASYIASITKPPSQPSHGENYSNIVHASTAPKLLQEYEQELYTSYSSSNVIQPAKPSFDELSTISSPSRSPSLAPSIEPSTNSVDTSLSSPISNSSVTNATYTTSIGNPVHGTEIKGKYSPTGYIIMGVGVVATVGAFVGFMTLTRMNGGVETNLQSGNIPKIGDFHDDSDDGSDYSWDPDDYDSDEGLFEEVELNIVNIP
mmetsp:Transcript_14260/g.16580  ORF Transcript_14260/g.16580 Transcript_14260/m.16580 type:complete len:252 (+) Transcript_14260:102-857(+)